VHVGSLGELRLCHLPLLAESFHRHTESLGRQC
jgi:hypothetical protein